jgi:hypothetical protein
MRDVNEMKEWIKKNAWDKGNRAGARWVIA